MVADARFDSLEQMAYDRLFLHHDTADEALATLLESGENETIAAMALQSAYSRRHQEALEGQLDYASWLAAVFRNLGGSGPLVLALGLVSAAAAGAALFALSESVPHQERLRIYYWIVAFIVGLCAFFLGSGPVYWWLHRSVSQRARRRRQIRP